MQSFGTKNYYYLVRTNIAFREEKILKTAKPTRNLKNSTLLSHLKKNDGKNFGIRENMEQTNIKIE